MGMVMELVKLVCSIGVVGTVLWLVYVYGNEWVKSQRVRRKLRMQGISGPPPSFLHGNLLDMHQITAASQQGKVAGSSGDHTHDFTESLFPYFEFWRKQYGTLYTYSTGIKQHLYVNRPEIVSEMNKLMTLDLGKPSHITNNLASLLGNGILRANGISWSHQRKLVAPEFYMEKVKGMVDLMIESAQPLLTKWDRAIEAKGSDEVEIEVDEDLRSLAADVISRVCFGHSYSKGIEVFSKLRLMQKKMSKHGAFLFGIKGLREKLKYIWREKENEIEIMERENIYFAGHETIAVTASWALMLLAVYPEWQDRVRKEVAQIFSNGLPNADDLPLLKTLTMVIQEVLRLYPPGAFVSREVYKDTQIGELNVPKGVCLWTLIPTLHRDPEVWGPNANEFEPERFKDGVSKACKYPQAYVPFGVGPRLCVGKNFAMVQLKVVLALIISRFSFSLSPSYKHAPAYRMIIEPGHGVHILIHKI
ncbi:hypothetical protein PIB30_060533 [Stylosanthes scabra]|uniref:Cytochrome P450 714A1-like n=1 Tax=Stylosanthes scabra TaxID=79078 RepID=A0ABU6XLX8_9FABA|nr:hypothetical protein [Stylosanthes scabra]